MRINKKLKRKSCKKKRKTKVGGSKNNPTMKNYMYIMSEDKERDEASNDHTPVDSANNSYNENLFVRESHNCYTYFLNLKT